MLHTSRQVYEEAAAVAYGSIRFTLVDRSEQTRLLECFLDTIGPANSSVVSYLSMDFPHVDISTDGVGESRVGAESVRGIELPRDRCTGLRTLETKMHGLAANGWTKVDEQNLGPVCDGLSQVNVRLREIPSLNKVIVRIYGGTLRPSVIEAMKRLKWIVFIGDRMEPVQ